MRLFLRLEDKQKPCAIWVGYLLPVTLLPPLKQGEGEHYFFSSVESSVISILCATPCNELITKTPARINTI